MEFVLDMLAGLFVAIVFHEAGHAAFALAVSRGPVTLQAGFGPTAGVHIGRLELRVGPVLLGGVCTHDGGERRGDRVLIAAAGPVASIFLTALAWSLRDELWALLHPLGPLADQVSIASGFMALFTLVPMRYPGYGESDGLAILRALFPTSPVALRPPAPTSRPERPLRVPFAIVLGLCTVLAFMTSFWLGFALLALFGFAWLGERSAA